MSPEEREELASLYVLGALEGDELAAFERELTAHPELALLVTDLERASTILATSLPQHRAPEVVRQSVFQRIRREAAAAEPPPRPAFSLGWIPWAIAAALAVSCALFWNDRFRLAAAFANVEQENQALHGRIATLDAERARLESRVTALERERQDLQVRVASLEERDPLREIQPITLTAQPGAPTTAEVVALWDPHRRTGALHAHLPEPAADKDYQLWIITPESKQPVDAGIVPALTDFLTFTAARPVNQVAALAISIEPKGGSTAPQGPVVYLGKL